MSRSYRLRGTFEIRCPCGGTAVFGQAQPIGSAKWERIILHSQPPCNAYAEHDPTDYASYLRAAHGIMAPADA